MLRLVYVVSVTLAALSATPASGRAQAAGEYDRSIKAAVEEYDSGHFSEARALFQRAHALQPSARTLRGLGISAAELRLYVEAVSELEAALAHGTRPLTAGQRAEVEQVLQRARLSVARVTLSTDPSDATVTVDGRAIQLREGELWLNPGEYTANATAPGYAPQSRAFRAISGTQRLTLVLVVKTPEPTEAAAAPVQRSPAPAGTLEVDAEPGSLPTLFWVAAAGAAAFGGTALALHLVAQGEADAIEKDCPVEPQRACSRAEIGRRIDDAGIPTLNVLSGVTLGLACASALGAGLAIALDGGGDDAQPVSVAVTPQGASFAVKF